ncbi:unnamed protein product [Blepharisma stoltei]|uniref:Uncharacterized protein n=1 Tax=Blepharisma stoltei TaxID=1481888 RepID=A0AAU9JUY2_9CILI|nr:unnamed protein product [Blepharisma stoltei]
MEFSYKYISKALDGLIDCEVNKITNTSQNVYLLLIFGTFISLICSGIILYFAYSVEKRYDEFWLSIRKNTLDIYEKLRETAIDRLINTHGVLDIPQTSNQTGHRKGAVIKKIKSKMLLKYSKKIIIIVLISISFYFLFLVYLYNNCLNDMKNRPLLLSCFVYTRALISRIGFFARDASHQRTAIYYPNMYGFKNPTLRLYETIENLELKIREIRKSKFSSIMSASLKEQIFKKSDSDSFLIKYGSLSGINIVIIEAYWTESSNNANQQDRNVFVDHYTLMQEIVGSQYKLADQDSKDAIYYELKLLIYVASTYSAALVLLFCIYYLPFLRKELEIVGKLRTLMAVVCSKLDQGIESAKFE